MIKLKQLLRHDPDNGVYGDCHRTVLACLLHLSPTEVPNFAENWDNIDAWRQAEQRWRQAEQRWLASLGLSSISIAFNGPLEEVLACQKSLNPGMYYMLVGTSRNRVNHVVICCDDEIVWDTSIDNSGIVGPAEGGYYWVEYLVPRILVRSCGQVS